MVDDKDATTTRHAVSHTCPDFNIDDITSLCGDASTRRYLRAMDNKDGSLVVMMVPEPEAVEWFRDISRLMIKLGVDAPKVFGVYYHCAVLEDLGDTMLQNAMVGASEDDFRLRYGAILADLAEFQSQSLGKPDGHMPCYNLAFDHEKLMWEMEFANIHFLTGYLEHAPDDEYLEKSRKCWGRVCDELAASTPVLAHRDLHSRNIMLHDERRVWIDYQDARMGRRQYDLASLLYDPYVDMPQNVRDELLSEYRSMTSFDDKDSGDDETFNRLYNYSSAQRLYKALGTYGYQTHALGVDTYLPFIPVACKSLLHVLKVDNNLIGLYDLLAPTLEPFVEGALDR